MGTRPAIPTPEAQPVINPHIERHPSPPPSPLNIPSHVPVFAMDYTEKAATLEAQEAVAKDYQAEELRAKAKKMVNFIVDDLKETQRRPGPKADAIAQLASNKVLHRHLDLAQTYARARSHDQHRAQAEAMINEAQRANAEAVRIARIQAEREALEQAVRETQRRNVAKRQAADEENRLREAQVQNKKMALGQERGRSPTRTLGKTKRDDSTATQGYPEGTYVVKERRNKPPKKQNELMSQEAISAFNEGLSKAAKVVANNGLKSEEATKALNKGLNKASRVVPGKTALNVKYRKGIKEGLTNAKVKAHVEPQPDSSTTAIRKKKSGVILPIKNSKIKKGPMEKVRAVALPVS